MWLNVCLFLCFPLTFSSCFHSITVKDYKAANEKFLIRRFEALDWFNCILSCQEETRCFSYNYQLTTKTQSNGLCEMFRCGFDKRKDIESTLVYSDGFVFQQLKDSSDAPICSDYEKSTDTNKPKESCKQGWVRNGSSCFMAVNERLQWDQALEHCNKIGGNLTSIRNEQENSLLVELSADFERTHFWIGLRMKDGEFNTWEDGTVVGYNNWKNEQPPFQSESCVNVIKKSGKWRTYQCEEKNPLICRYML